MVQSMQLWEPCNLVTHDHQPIHSSIVPIILWLPLQKAAGAFEGKAFWPDTP